MLSKIVRQLFLFSEILYKFDASKTMHGDNLETSHCLKHFTDLGTYEPIFFLHFLRRISQLWGHMDHLDILCLF